MNYTSDVSRFNERALSCLYLLVLTAVLSFPVRAYTGADGIEFATGFGESVNGDLTAPTYPAQPTVCPGDNPRAIIPSTPASTTGPGTISYQWFSTTTGCDATDYVAIPGAIRARYNPPDNSVTETTYFRVIASAPDGTGTICRDTSECVIVAVAPDCEPTIELAATCICFDVEYDAPEIDPLEFVDSLRVFSTPGETWRVVENFNAEAVDSFVNRPLPIDTVLTEISPGIYTLSFAHTANLAYEVRVTNAPFNDPAMTPGDTLTVTGGCEQPELSTPALVSSVLCGNQTLTLRGSSLFGGNILDGDSFVFDLIEDDGTVTENVTTIDLTMFADGETFEVLSRYEPPATPFVSPTPANDFCGQTNFYSFVIDNSRCVECELSYTVGIPECTYDVNSGTSSFVVDLVVSTEENLGDNLIITLDGIVLDIVPANASGTTVINDLSLGNFGPAFGRQLTISYAAQQTCRVTRPLDLISCAPSCTGSAGQIGGTVFQDFELDGTRNGGEDGQANTRVLVYDCDGNIVCDVLSNENGDWSCPGLTDGEMYRVEFTLPEGIDAVDVPTAGSNTTSVQFATAPGCGTDYAMVDLELYCAMQTDLSYTLACYQSGNGEGINADDIGMVLFNRDESGVAMNDGGAAPNAMSAATVGEVGSIWGSAFQRTTGRLYSATTAKRVVGIAESPAHIMITAYDAGAGSFLGSFSLDGVDGLDMGTIDRTDAPGMDNSLTADPVDPGRDIDGYAQVGKVGFGDADLDEAQEFLYTINLQQRNLVRVDVRNPALIPTDGSVIDAGLVEVFDLPISDCIGGVFRPWGLDFNNGLGYVGGVCTGENTADLRDTDETLVARIFEFDPADPTGSLREVFTLPLDYVRERAGPPLLGTWMNWTDDYQNILSTNGTSRVPNPDAEPELVQVAAPQPILSDFDFTEDGCLVITFKDRFGDQGGRDLEPPIPGYTGIELHSVIAAGEILKACPLGAEYVIEGTEFCVPNNDDDVTVSNPGPDFGRGVNGTQVNDGPTGVGEFFYEDYYTGLTDPGLPFYAHGEVSLGSVFIDPISGEVINVAYDPVNRRGGAGFNTAGIKRYDINDGSQTSAYSFVPQAGNVLGKGIALGDIELVCDPLPVQIGNYVWLDDNEDGIQQACEPALGGVTVKLYTKPSDGSDPVQIATATTSETGEYYFMGPGMDNAVWTGTEPLQRDSAYVIAFCGEDGFNESNNSIQVDGRVLCLTTPDVTAGEGNDQNDSDATVQPVGTGNLPAYCIINGELAAGTDHTFDVGFKELTFDLALRKTVAPNQMISVEPGDQVIFDILVVNQGEVPAFSIAVGDSIATGLLYDATGTTPTGTVTTANAEVVGFTNNYDPNTDGVFIIDSLAAGDMVTFQVAVTIDAVGTAPPGGQLDNFAEIQAADNDRDPGNTPPTDEDSVPDTNFSNDSGGDPTGDSNDALDGDGTGAIDDDDPDTDEDDADGAVITVLDLALTKEIDPGSIDPTGAYAQGDEIVYNLNVYNQGQATVSSVEIVDFIPCGFSFDPTNPANDGWTEEVDDMLARYTETVDILPEGGIQVQITLVFEGEANCAAPTDTAFLNRAEISAFTDEFGNPATDFDSTPDDINGNDGGGMINSVSDNIITGDGTGAPGSDDPATDEDDSDPANLDVFDLAIFKVVSPDAGPGPFSFGDVVKFDISVISQGNLPATAVTISDLTPAGLTFEPGLGMNTTAGNGAGWQGDPAEPTLSITDFTGLIANDPGSSTLGFLDTATVSIWLRVDPVTGGTDDDYTNLAGIQDGSFVNPMNNMTVVVTTGDGDSPYGLPRGGDTGDGVGSADDNETMDNVPGEDIDSQDPAFVMVVAGVAVGDEVFIDVNEDGIRDADDLPLAGVTVTLIDAETGAPVTEDIFGNPIVPLQTDMNGNYLFTDLPSGNYAVRFDISTAPNAEFYDFTIANTGDEDRDSDVTPDATDDDVATSVASGLIAPGDTLRTLDAGVRCAIMAVVADDFTICQTGAVDLTAGASITPASLGGLWTSDGDGVFLDSTGEEVAQPAPFGLAVRYEPGPEDGLNGAVVLTLTTNPAPGDVPCEQDSDSVTVTVLKVDCGAFFWDGNDD